MPNLGQAEVAAWLTEVPPGDEAAWPPAIRQLEETGPASEQLVALGMALDGLVPADLPQLQDSRSRLSRDAGQAAAQAAADLKPRISA